MARRMMVATFAVPIALAVVASITDPSGEGWLTAITFGVVWALVFPFALVASGVAVVRARAMSIGVATSEWQQRRGHVVTYGRAVWFGTFVSDDGEVPVLFRSFGRTHKKLANAAVIGELLVAKTSARRWMLAPLDRSFVVPGLSITRRSHQNVARETARGIEEWTRSREGQRHLHSGREYAASLESEDGAYLRLAIFRYEFDNADDWHDRNWLRVRGTVSTGDVNWGFEHPCLLTTEARELANWLSKAATSTTPPAPLSFTEPHLAFQVVTGAGNTVTIAVTLAQECRPASARHEPTGERYTVQFVIDREAAQRAAQRLQGQLQDFPER